MRHRRSAVPQKQCPRSKVCSFSRGCATSGGGSSPHPCRGHGAGPRADPHPPHGRLLSAGRRLLPPQSLGTARRAAPPARGAQFLASKLTSSTLNTALRPLPSTNADRRHQRRSPGPARPAAGARRPPPPRAPRARPGADCPPPLTAACRPAAAGCVAARKCLRRAAAAGCQAPPASLPLRAGGREPLRDAGSGAGRLHPGGVGAPAGPGRARGCWPPHVAVRPGQDKPPRPYLPPVRERGGRVALPAAAARRLPPAAAAQPARAKIATGGGSPARRGRRGRGARQKRPAAGGRPCRDSGQLTPPRPARFIPLEEPFGGPAPCACKALVLRRKRLVLALP